MKRQLFLIVAFVFMVSACHTSDQIIEDNLENRDYPLPEVVKPVMTPIAEPIVETTDEVLKERTIKDTRRAGKPGGYKATLFPKSESKADDGTAFKLTW